MVWMIDFLGGWMVQTMWTGQGNRYITASKEQMLDSWDAYTSEVC